MRKERENLLYSAEHLGIIDSVTVWLLARKPLNLPVHEYMIDPEQFALTIRTVHNHVPVLLTTYERLRQDALDHLVLDSDRALRPLTLTRS